MPKYPKDFRNIFEQFQSPELIFLDLEVPLCLSPKILSVTLYLIIGFIKQGRVEMKEEEEGRGENNRWLNGWMNEREKGAMSESLIGK